MAVFSIVQLVLILTFSNGVGAFRTTVVQQQNLTSDTSGPFTGRNPSQYQVFVKKIQLMCDWCTLNLAWHTEIMFCPIGENNEDFHELFHDKVLTDQRQVTAQEFDILKGSDYVGQNCLVTGYAGITPQRIQFGDTSPRFFYGKYGTQELHYGGQVNINLLDFIAEMRKCGNWEPKYYSLLYHNCNYFTKRVMDALGFPSPTFQAEKVLGSAWIPEQGYLEVATGKCRGTKCTGKCRGEVCWKAPRTGVCDEGMCWDGTEFNPKDRTCGPGTLNKMFSAAADFVSNLVSSDAGAGLTEDQALELERGWVPERGQKAKAPMNMGLGGNILPKPRLQDDTVEEPDWD